MNKEKLAQTALEKGMTSLVILEGKAPEQHNEQPVSISGCIDAPHRFLQGKGNEFKGSQSHALVSRSKGKIELILNEQSVCNKYNVIGEIEVSKKFKDLGINNESMPYNTTTLANKFKFLRTLFSSNLEHMNICTTLKNIVAKVNQEVQNSNDSKGNISNLFSQTVESNIPPTIRLNIPMIEGEQPVEIEVNIRLEAHSGNEIRCYLESMDAADLLEKQFQERVDQEVEKLKDLVTIIFY